MFNTPILLIIFNRPELTQQLMLVIEQIKPSRLFISSDGPRIQFDSDKQLVNSVREICSKINWDCSVLYNYQMENLGCYRGPRTAIDWFFSHVDEGIILEDDCLPTMDFFLFTEIMLNRYRNDTRILNICGSNMGFANSYSHSYFYSRFMNMSGWATWRRSASSVDYELRDWSKTRFRKWKAYKLLRTHIFDFDTKWFRYWIDKFNRTLLQEKVTWWDWQWIYHQLNHKQLSVVPSKNLVSNVGFNSAATHTIDPTNPLANLPTENMSFPISHPIRIRPDLNYEKEAVKWIWCYHKRESFVQYSRQLLSYITKLF